MEGTAVKRILKLGLIALLALSAGVAQARAAEGEIPRLALSAGFADWVEQVMADWNAVGVAVAAVHLEHGEFAKGYGYRDLEKRLPVTAETVMPIGSVTKSFTAVILAQLVDEGKLGWDDLVRRHLPDFRLRDEYAAENMRVRDLLTHVSGLPRHDRMWAGRAFSRREIYERLRYLEPSATFRGRVQYQNLMYLTAGYLAERITGETWDDLIRTRIFKPLGMERATTTVKDIESLGDVSESYWVHEGRPMRLPLANLDHIAPAGAINASVAEMIPYLRARMSMGRDARWRLASEENEAFMQSGHVVWGAPPQRRAYAEISIPNYGIALFVRHYRGHRLVHHAGEIGGFRAEIAWLPDDGAGAVVLTNSNGEARVVKTVILRRLLDELLGLDPIDWNAREHAEEAEERPLREAARKEKEEKLKAAQVADAPPTHPLRAYAGRYTNPAYGALVIGRSGEQLDVTFGESRARLEHYHFNMFRLTDDGTFEGKRLRGGLSGFVRFDIGKDGRIEGLSLPLEPAVSDIEFVKIDSEETE